MQGEQRSCEAANEHIASLAEVPARCAVVHRPLRSRAWEFVLRGDIVTTSSVPGVDVGDRVLETERGKGILFFCLALGGLLGEAGPGLRSTLRDSWASWPGETC